MRVALMDPSIADFEGEPSPNSGDQIIARAVLRVIEEVFPDAELVRLPTHVPPTRAALRSIRDSDHVIVGGSNLLGNRQFSRRRLEYWQQWPISLKDAQSISRAVLLGVGWRVYEPRVQRHTRLLLRAALAESGLHSVRDGYTVSMLDKAGGLNAVNTACPTLWRLFERHSGYVSDRRSDTVLTTLTDYRQNPTQDRALLILLRQLYDRVVLWPQGSGDLEYLQSLDCAVEPLDQGLNSLDEFLATTDFDYVGTRLHGGIHCLDAGRRSLILAVDNRAAEMLPPLRVPHADVGNLREIQSWVEEPSPTVVRGDMEAISRWKAQF